MKLTPYLHPVFGFFTLLIRSLFKILVFSCLVQYYSLNTLFVRHLDGTVKNQLISFLSSDHVGNMCLSNVAVDQQAS